MASPFSPTGLFLDAPTAFSAKQLESDIHAYNRCLNHTFSRFFNFIASHVMSWSDGEGVAVGQLNFQFEDVTSVHQKFSTGCSLSKLSVSSNGKQWNFPILDPSSTPPWFNVYVMASTTFMCACEARRTSVDLREWPLLWSRLSHVCCWSTSIMHHFEIHIHATDDIICWLELCIVCFKIFQPTRNRERVSTGQLHFRTINSWLLDHNIILLRRHHTATSTMKDRLSAATLYANGITRSCIAKTECRHHFSKHKHENFCQELGILFA